MHALNSVVNNDLPSWRQVSAVADLAEIYQPDVQVCSWQRNFDPQISTYLGSVAHLGNLQWIETLTLDDRARLEGLPMGEGREQLVDDLALLTEIFSELLDCPAVGFRGTRVEHAMCPKWHIDRVPIRLLCTYEGPGTEWLDDQRVAQGELSKSLVADGACHRAAVGDVVLLKGALWQDNEGHGAVHRSPAIAKGAGRRTLVSLDPLWLD